MHLNPVALPAIFCAVVLYCLGSILAKKAETRPKRFLLFLAGAVLALPAFLFALYYTHLFDNAAWFYRFRALPYTELAVGGCGLLFGVVNSWFEPETLGEKLVIPAAFSIILIIPFVKPLLDPIDLDRLRDRCDGEVCMQSTFSTCGPSSAATILKALGQTASERELARECLTSRGGSEVWYIARALERRGLHTRILIQSPDRLLPPSPAIAGVVLPGGVGHFVAIMNTTADEVTIGDSMKGKLVLKNEDLGRYYRFSGFFLVVQSK